MSLGRAVITVLTRAPDSGEWEVFTCPPVNADKTIGPRTGASTIVLHNKLYGA